VSGLRAAAARIARAPATPHPPASRKLATERVAAKLAALDASGGMMNAAVEEWEAVATRLDFNRLERARPRDLRRAIADIWTDSTRDAQAAPVVGHGLAAGRKSFDRALLLAYLRRFDPDHPAFSRLAHAAGIAADRHDWPWRARGREWQLWDLARGPGRVGDALVRADDPAAVLGAAGLDGDLAQGGFALKALRTVCDVVSESRGAEAERLGTKLIALFDRLEVRQLNTQLAVALLTPWARTKPREEYRKRIGALLVKRIGDPRINAAAWAALGVPADLVAVLRGWLVETAVRAFFAIVGRTTDRKDQWAAREAFWLGYLDVGAITDAWFAFGRQAESLAGAIAREEAVQYGRVVGGADPSHSSLILSIGDTRIAEWSHNGSCRFWPASHKSAPVPYRPSYDGHALRTTTGGAGFAYIPHQGGWEGKFARKVHATTGVVHPKHGRG
jgi:hypothetical protein